MSEFMRLLAIETSCDETAIAVVEHRGTSAFRVLANIVSSQAKLHEKFGGVVPNLARREHEKNLPAVLLKALKEGGFSISKSKFPISDKGVARSEEILVREAELLPRFKKLIAPLKKPAIDAIAVTNGPGLAPALWTGVNFARALAALWNVPLIPVNHMEGHIFSALLTKQKTISNSKLLISKKDSPAKRSALNAIRFPAIALLVSGGHTELHLIKKSGDYRRIGETLDDAAGEAFDKVAKMLGLPYPGGPAISKLAESGNPRAVNFPRPMINAKNYDFSFSGLKTSVLYHLRDLTAERPTLAASAKADVAASFEQAAADVLVSKTIRAAKQFGAKTILIGGGVAANKKLRTELAKKIKEELPGALFFAPDPKDTGDNALMIALAALYGKAGRVLRDKKRSPRLPSGDGRVGADANARL